MRDKAQADFDIDRFVDLFDKAMTSSDPRVIETLHKLIKKYQAVSQQSKYSQDVISHCPPWG